MKRLFLILLLSFPCSILLSQTIRNVEFTTKGNKIIVTYDLVDCPENYVYDISLKFKDDDDKMIIPKNLGGDISLVLPGINKTIVWEPLSENVDIKGRIAAIVEISDKHKRRYETRNSFNSTTTHKSTSRPKTGGGPANALKSMIMPGWGDYAVNPGQNKGYYLISLGYIVCLGGALGEYANYKTNYEFYHSSTIQSGMDSYFDKASTNYKNMQLYIGVAATIWVADVVHVLVRGIKNNNNRNSNRYSNANEKFRLHFAGANGGMQIGFSTTL